MAIPAFLQAIVGPTVNKVLDLIPNKNERERARESVEKTIIDGAMAAANAQARINEQEAQHKSLFVAGWRPAVGWIAAIALGWNYIVQPLLMWIGFLMDVDLSGAPKLDTNELVTILMGMLGLGSLRTYEKYKGVARNPK